MELHNLAEIREDGRKYIEFLRRPDLSVGIYRLAPGSEDLQQPHTEDEIYLVTSGKARFLAGERNVSVTAGDLIFIPAYEPHRFHEITEPLEVLVIFAPAEGSRTPLRSG